MFLFSSISLSQDWEIYATGANNENLYFDKTTFRIIEGYRYIWILVDYQKTIGQLKGKNVLSSKSYIKVDCASLGSKTLQSHYYSLPMGKDLIGSNSNPKDNWHFSPPGSPNHHLISIMCKE